MFPANTQAGGVHMTMGPLDTCKTPSPGGPIPIPYANMVDGQAQAGDPAAKATQKKIIDDAAAKGYKADSATKVAIAQGDEAGIQKGLVSSKNMDKTSRSAGFSKVKVEGKKVTNVMRATGHNGANANAPAGMQIAPSQTKVIIMG